MGVFALCGCVLRIPPLTHNSSGELKLRSVFFSPPCNLFRQADDRCFFSPRCNLIRQADDWCFFSAHPVIWLCKLMIDVFFYPPCNLIMQADTRCIFSPPCNLIRQSEYWCILKWILLVYIFRFSKDFSLYWYTIHI